MASKAKQETPSPSSSNDQLSSAIDPEVLEQNLEIQFNTHSSASGEVIMPCLPSMLDYTIKRLDTLFETIGHKLSQEEVKQLRELIASKIQKGFRASPYARLVVRYKPDPTSSSGLTCNVSTEILSVADQYQRWVQNREPPLFGHHPDAKVMAVAAQLGSPVNTPVLDVGAGTGRNSLPLAQQKHPVEAIELSSALAEQLLKAAVAQNLPIRVVEGDILDPLVRMRPAYYKLAIAAEVVSHFRDTNQIRLFLAKMCDFLKSGGMLLFNAFLALDGYQPDDRVREISQVSGSYIITPSELRLALEDLPLEIVSDESVIEYERTHLPPEAWPPTSWFISWASGHDLFPLQEKPPIELRWLLCKRL